MAIIISSGVYSSGATVNSDSVYVYAGGTAEAFTFIDHAKLYLSGGTVLCPVVNGVSDIEQTAGYLSGGTVGGTKDEDCTYVLRGGTALGMTLLSYGTEQVYAGTYVSYTLVSGGAIQTVMSGAAVSNTRLKSRGTLVVVSGGTAVNVLVSSASTVDNGGQIIASVIGGDTKTKITGTNSDGAFSLSNGVASNFIVYNSANLTVEEGGIASGTTIWSGGVLEVNAGGSAVNTTQNSGGIINCTVSDDGTLISGTNTSGTFCLQNGVASGFQLYGGAYQSVEFGGIASNTEIFAYGLLEVQEGGSAVNVRLSSGGELLIGVGGTATGVIQSAGGVIQLNVDGIEETYVTGTNELGGSFRLSGGIASGFILTSSSYLYNYDGGTVQNTVISGGGQLNFYGGVGSNLILRDDAHVDLYTSTSAVGVTLSGGFFGMVSGILSDVTILSGGELQADGGTITNVAIRNGSMGVAGDVKLSGTVSTTNEAQIAFGDATVSASKLSFTYNLVSVADDYLLVDDFRVISGSTFTINCDSSRVLGDYLLAGEASSCSASFNLKVDNISVGTLTVGNSLEYNDKTYLLTNDDGVLTLSVSGEGLLAYLYAGTSVVTSGVILSGYSLDGSPYTKIKVQGGIAENTAVHTNGSIEVESGSVVSATMDGGLIRIQSGSIDGLNMGGGSLKQEGGVASNISLSGGSITLSGGTLAHAVLNAAKATDCILSASGVANSRTAINDLTVSGGTTMITQYADVTDLTVLAGTVNMNNSGVANSSRTVVSGAVLRGGIIQGNAGLVLNDVSVYSGLLWVSQAVYASNVTLYGGTISARGNTPRLTDLHVSGGVLEVQKAIVNTVDITGGRTWLAASNGDVTATGITLSGGTLDILPSGTGNLTVTGVTVRGGTMSCNTTGTTHTVTVSNTNVSGGDVTLYGGTFKDLAVSGGAVHLTTGQTSTYLAGSIELAAAANVNLTDASGTGLNYSCIDDSAATWNFNLTDRTSASVNMMNDMAFSDAAGYAISVSVAQKSGDYKIVGGASVLEGKTFSFNVGSTGVAGGITVNGNTVDYAGKSYTLTLVDGELSLNVYGDDRELVKLYKGGTVVAIGASFDNITLGGGQYDSVTILSGGTVTNLTYVSGGISVKNGGVLSGVTYQNTAKTTIDYEVYDISADMNFASALIFSSGANVHGANLTGAAVNAFRVSSGAVLSNVVLTCETNSTFHTFQGCVISGLSTTSNTQNGEAGRLSGTFVNGDFAGGTAKLYGSGVAGGIINISSGAGFDIGYSRTKLSGATVNVLGGGTLFASHGDNTMSKHPTITGDSLINIYSGGVMYEKTELSLDGAINFRGGTLQTVITAGHSGLIMGSGARINVYADSKYLTTSAMSLAGTVDYNNATYSFVVEGTPAVGSYTLLSSASGLTQNINITVDGETVGSLAKNKSIVYGGYAYTYTNAGSVVITVQEVGAVSVYDGDTAVMSVNVANDIVLDDNPHTKIVIDAGGTANNTIVRNGGTFEQLSGTANGVTVSGGTANVKNGVANGITVSDGVTIISGGAVTDVTVAGGVAVISGGAVTDVTVAGGVAIISGGTVTGISGAVNTQNGLVISGGTVFHFDLYANTGSAISINGYLSGGTLHIVDSGVNILKSATVEDLQLYGSARMSGFGSNVNIFSGGTLQLFSSGCVNGVTNVYNGGVISLTYNDKSTHVREGGQLYGTVNLSSGAKLYANHYSNTIAKIGSDAVINVYDGAVISQGNVNPGVLSIVGTINLCGGSIKNASKSGGGAGIDFSGGTLNFNLAGIASGNSTAYVSNYSYITGFSNATCTVNVDSSATGQYKLFGGASGFNCSIKLFVDGENTQKSLSVGGEVLYKGKKYTLTTGNSLYLTISEVPPITIYNGAEVIATATTVSGIVINGTDRTKMVVEDGGTATDTSLSNGGALVVSGGTVTGVSGTLTKSGTLLVNGGEVSNVNVSVGTTESAVIVSGGVVSDAVVSGGVNAIVIESNGTVNDLDIYGSARVSGVVSGANIYYNEATDNGTLRTYIGGQLDGEINVYEGAMISIASATVDNGGQILGTVNLHRGAQLDVSYNNNKYAKIASTAVINVAEGAVVSQGSRTLVIAGTVNLSGGRIVNTAIAGGNGIDLTGGTLNFSLAGELAAATAYVVNYDDIAGRDTFSCSLDVAAFSQEEYILFGTASTFNRTISLSVDGTSIGEIGLSTSALDAVHSLRYSLTRNSENQIVLTSVVAGGESAASTGTITTEVNDGADVAATWDNSTNYTTGIVTIGNSGDYEHIGLLVSNDGTKGGSTTLCGGAASADVSAEIDIRIQQGTIGAVVGGARFSQYSVGGVNLIVGGGTAAAEVRTVYGGGMGSVDGAVAVAIESGAVVSGQLYGGGMMNKAANNISVNGDIALGVTGGTLTGDVVGGGRVSGNGISTYEVNGSISMSVTGGDFAGGSASCVYGGGWVVGSDNTRYGADYTVSDGVAISVSDADIAIGTAAGRGIFGGALASNYGVAEISGGVSIIVENSTVGNIFGGGWAQTGAVSTVEGDVNISLTNSTADVIYGGGAHALLAVETSVAGETRVNGEVNITLTDSTVSSVYAVGQVKGDFVTGDATVTVSGTSVAECLVGSRHDGSKDPGTVSTLIFQDFTGFVFDQIQGFDQIRFSGDCAGVFRCGESELENSNWNFDLSENSGAETVLTWQNGSLAEDNIRLDLVSSNAAGWNICDLSGDDSEGALDDAVFSLYIDGTAYSGEFEVGSTISDTGTALDGMTLTYEDGVLSLRNGSLA